MLNSRLYTLAGVTRFYAVVVVVFGQTNSSKQAHRVGELLAVDGRPDNVVSMLPYDEGHIRDILDQARGWGIYCTDDVAGSRRRGSGNCVYR